MIGYFRNNFDAVRYFDQTFTVGLIMTNGKNSYSIGYVTGVTNQQYFYNHYNILIGITKNYNVGAFEIGFRGLVGCMRFHFPDSKGTIEGARFDTTAKYGWSQETFNWQLYGGQYYVENFDVGVKFGVRILPHIYVSANVDFMISNNVSYNMLDQITEPNGNIVQNTYIEYKSVTGFFYPTIGIEYKP
jgi:hypothetical protein